MKRSTRVSEETKTNILTAIKAGASVKDIAEKYGVSTAAIYTWQRPQAPAKKITTPTTTTTSQFRVEEFGVARELLSLSSKMIEKAFTIIDRR